MRRRLVLLSASGTVFERGAPAGHGSQVDSIQVRTNKGKVLSAGGSGRNAAHSHPAPPGLCISDFSGRPGPYLDAVGACIASPK